MIDGIDKSVEVCPPPKEGTQLFIRFASGGIVDDEAVRFGFQVLDILGLTVKDLQLQRMTRRRRAKEYRNQIVTDKVIQVTPEQEKFLKEKFPQFGNLTEVYKSENGNRQVRSVLRFP